MSRGLLSRNFAGCDSGAELAGHPAHLPLRAGLLRPSQPTGDGEAVLTKVFKISLPFKSHWNEKAVLDENF